MKRTPIHATPLGYLTVAEAAEAVGVDPNVLFRRIDEHEIGFIRKRSRYFIPQDQIKHWRELESARRIRVRERQGQRWRQSAGFEAAFHRRSSTAKATSRRQARYQSQDRAPKCRPAPSEEALDPRLTVRETAERLGVTRSALYARLLRGRSIQAERDRRGRMRIHEQEVERWRPLIPAPYIRGRLKRVNASPGYEDGVGMSTTAHKMRWERHKRRTRDAILAAVTALLAQGRVPSVSDAAGAAGVPVRTVYRYFATQEQLLAEAAFEPLRLDVERMIDAADLSGSAEARLDALVRVAQQGAIAHEPLLRTMTRLMLSRLGAEIDADMRASLPLRSIRRIDWIELALAPARSRLGEARFERLVSSVALCLGIEPLLVLRASRSLDNGQSVEVLRWAARALLRASLQEVDDEADSGSLTALSLRAKDATRADGSPRSRSSKRR